MRSLRKIVINDAIRTTKVYFVPKGEDAEVAARRIQIRLTGRKGE
jgi:hypothetical protein